MQKEGTKQNFKFDILVNWVFVVVVVSNPSIVIKKCKQLALKLAN